MTVVLTDAALIQALATRSVCHLRAAKSAPDTPPLDDETLIAALARHPEPRLREALIALFIRHPEYAARVESLAAILEPSARETLQHMYTAAVYLQRFWRGALSIYLGRFTLLPDYFGQSLLGLREPDERFGEAGLRALAEHFKQKTGDEWLSAYESAMNLLLDQLRLELRRAEQVG